MLNFDFPSSLGAVTNSGLIRQKASDFQVKETLSFVPDGHGDHLFLNIEKEGCNTDWVAQKLAALAGLKPVDIGYAGLKDRHAVTTQWFSLHLPNKDGLDFETLPEEIRVLEKTRHTKKLRTGAISFNRFQLIIRELTGDLSMLDDKIHRVKTQGFPNYFGAQRFGRQNQNVNQLISMVESRRRVKRNQKSLYLSAGRSYLFNHILAERIQQENWNKIIEGDVIALNGSRSVFSYDPADDAIPQRLESGDIHPATVLWGRGGRNSDAIARQMEDKIIQAHPEITQALEKAGAEVAYRAMRLFAENLSWNVSDNTLEIKFDLPSGAYATSLLGEFINIR